MPTPVNLEYTHKKNLFIHPKKMTTARRYRPSGVSIAA